MTQDDNGLQGGESGLRIIQTLRFAGPPRSLAWSPDGSRIAVLVDETIVTYDIGSGQPIHSSPSIENIHNIVWPNRGDTIAYCGTLNHGLWDPLSNQMQSVAGPDSKYSICHMAADPNSRWIAIGGLNAPIIAFDMESHAILWRRWGNTRAIRGSHDGKTIAVRFEDTFALFDAETGQAILSLDRPTTDLNGQLISLSYNTDLAAIHTEFTINIIDINSKEIIVELEGHESEITETSFSSDGSLLASRSFNELYLWDTRNWTIIAKSNSILTSDPLGYTLAFSPAPQRRLAYITSDSIHILEVNLALVKPKSTQDNVLYTTARVALVGDSGVGKTSLGWRLKYDEFADKGSTHGQQFWVLDRMRRTREDGAICEVILWDLAGQPDYRIVHALFVNDADVALLLFDASHRDKPLEGVDYWVRALNRDGNLCPALLVGSRCDRGTSSLTSGELRDYCAQNNIRGAYVSTSAADRTGIDELIERLEALIPWNDLPPTVTTVTFKQIRELVLELKATASTDVLLSIEQLAAITHAHLDPAIRLRTIQAAVQHMQRHGYVATIATASGETYVLLAPELLANLASSIVLCARSSREGLGAIVEQRLRAGEYPFPELRDLSPSIQEILIDEAIRLFLASNLCFREILGASRLLVFPAVINEKPSRSLQTTLEEDNTYFVSGTIENVYSALVVLLGYTNNFTQHHRWQNHAQYELDPGETCSFEQISTRAGEIELVLWFAPSTRATTRELFRALFERFLEQRDVEITRYPRVQCECGYVQDRTQVIRRTNAKRGFLCCGECGTRIELPTEGLSLTRTMTPQATAGEFQARRRSRYQAALVRIQRLAERIGTPAPTCFISYAWGDIEHERWVERLARDLQSAGVVILLDRWHNKQVGANVARFTSRMAEQDRILVVGTPESLLASQEPVHKRIIAAERNLFEQRLTGAPDDRETVLPILRSGEESSSFPPLLRGHVYADFRDDASYFTTLFDLVLSLLGIAFEDPSVQDLRRDIRDYEQSGQPFFEH